MWSPSELVSKNKLALKQMEFKGSRHIAFILRVSAMVGDIPFSFILMFFVKKSRLAAMLAKSPPTMAAR